MSRTIDILSAIRNGEKYNASATSRADAILKSIANGTAYTDAPKSRVEELLLAIKNKKTASVTPQSRIEEILSAIANGTLDEYLSGRNLFDPFKAFHSTEMQDGYVKYTIFVGLPSTPVLVNSNTSESERQDGFYLKCASYAYDATYAWLYHPTTEVARGIGYTDENGRLSFYWKSANVETKAVIEHFRKMQVTVGESDVAYTPHFRSSELEEAFIATAIQLKGE